MKKMSWVTAWVMAAGLVLGVAARGAAGAGPVDPAQQDLTRLMEKRAKLKAGNINERMELARWCRDREMWQAMADLAREVLEVDPESKDAYGLLKEYDAKAPLPEEPEKTEQLRTEMKTRFGHDFKTKTTRHFLIVYDTTDAFAASRGAQLERAYDAFMWWFNMKRLRPMFLSERLVVQLLKERDDYVKYAREVDKQDLGWSAGYYSQRTNRITFYDDATSKEAELAEDKLDEARAKIKEYQAAIDKARQTGQTGMVNTLTAERNRLTQAIGKVNNQVGTAVGQSNAVKTMHEASHQLAFNTGVQKRLVDYPLWVAEGLACSFEVEDRYGGRGPGTVNAGRAEYMKKNLKSGKVLGIEALLKDPKMPMREEVLGEFYAEGWALFHFLYKTNREGMEKYLLAYQQMPALRKIPADKHHRMFEEAFGSVEEVEKRWLDYVKGLPGNPK